MPFFDAAFFLSNRPSCGTRRQVPLRSPLKASIHSDDWRFAGPTSCCPELRKRNQTPAAHFWRRRLRLLAQGQSLHVPHIHMKRHFVQREAAG